MKQVTPPEHTLSIVVLTVEATPVPWILDMTKRCRYLRPCEFIVVLDRHRKTVIAQAKEAGRTIHAVDQAVSIDDRRVMGAKAPKEQRSYSWSRIAGWNRKRCSHFFNPFFTGPPMR